MTPYQPEAAQAPDSAPADPSAQPAQAPAKKELSQAEKDLILREAVSSYLRSDFRDADIREVCEEYIAGVDKAARAAVSATPAGTT